MWYLISTEDWIKEVVKNMNEKQLNPEDAKFMIAFFSSMDTDFVKYFTKNKLQISSFSGENFHIFTPFISEDKIIPDVNWRRMKKEFISFGIPLNTTPTFIFFKLIRNKDFLFEPYFFAGFECKKFKNFPTKLKETIDKSIEIQDIQELINTLMKIFLKENIIPKDNISNEFKNTITNNFPKNTVFVSHSTSDKNFANKLINELNKEKSIKFWIDDKDIAVGDDIQKIITENLRISDYLLIIISENSTKSEWVNFEISQYMSKYNGKNIIPIVISEGQKFIEPVDNLIKRLNYLDFTDEKQWDNNIISLRKKLLDN